MRLFVAITVPEHVKEYLLSLPDMLHINGKLKKVHDTHITLKFLGKVPEMKCKEVIESLTKVIFEQFDIVLHNFGVFPNENYVRILWVGIKPDDWVNTLQKNIDAQLASQFQKEKNFKPHFTLARIKSLHNKKEFFDSLKQVKIEPMEIHVDSFSLMKSTLTPKGPVYETIQDFSSGYTKS